MQLNGNTLIDLFERIKDLLRDGRIDIVYNVANKQDLNSKLRETFRSLADLVSAKDSEKNFYRACISMITEHGHNDVEALAAQYKNLSGEIKDHALTLENYVTTLMEDLRMASEENITLKANWEELETRLRQAQTVKQSMEADMQHQIEKLFQEVERQREGTERELKAIKREVQERSVIIEELQQKLSKKQADLNDLQVKYQTLKKSHDKIQEELDRESMKNSISISVESEKLSQIIKEKDDELEFLRNRLNNDSLNVKPSAILGYSGILAHNKLMIPAFLSNTLERQVGRAVSSMEMVYSFAQQRRHNFHQSIDRRSNILLVCQTAGDILIGAFTTACFSLDSECSSTKAFLFGAKGSEISVNRLKSGRESIVYDLDFLIFGNDELCIEKGKCVVTSYSPHAYKNQLHYENSIKKDYFATALGDNGTTELKNYEIFQVQFAQ